MYHRCRYRGVTQVQYLEPGYPLPASCSIESFVRESILGLGLFFYHPFMPEAGVDDWQKRG